MIYIEISKIKETIKTIFKLIKVFKEFKESDHYKVKKSIKSNWEEPCSQESCAQSCT